MSVRFDLDAALQALATAGRDYARLRTRETLRSSLQRVLEEAAVTLPAAVRQRLDRALGETEATRAPLVEWIALLAESRRALEDDVGGRIGRAREGMARGGFLLDPAALGKILAALAEDPASIPDLAGVLERRRALSLAEAEIDRRETELRRAWERAAREASATVGTAAVEAAEGGLKAGDPLPAAEALDELVAVQARARAGHDPLAEARAGCEAAIDAAIAFLSPTEIDWVRAALARCPRGAPPGGGAGADEAVLAGWKGALRHVQDGLGELMAARRSVIEGIERWMGGAEGLQAAGYRRLLLLIEAFRERRAAADGRLEEARRRCLEAEWELSRAVWEDGGLASPPALFEARRAFLDCHRARPLAAEAGVLEIARATARAAARVRLEASWRRRWLLRHGRATERDRHREAQRLAPRLAADAGTLSDEDLERRCRQAEASLRAGLARLCDRLRAAEGPEPQVAGRARQALEAADPARIENALREARA
jgi:hypothetical protein